jgi:ubiquitin-like modifier-activating enzyme ATG7
MTKSNEAAIPEGIFGILPHSIRGYLSSFQHILPATERFTQCIACSEYVLQQYDTHGNEFLLRVFDSAEYLEEVTGIDKMGQLDNEVSEKSPKNCTTYKVFFFRVLDNRLR